MCYGRIIKYKLITKNKISFGGHTDPLRGVNNTLSGNLKKLRFAAAITANLCTLEEK
jgi:hypothetical protein